MLLSMSSCMQSATASSKQLSVCKQASHTLRVDFEYVIHRVDVRECFCLPTHPRGEECARSLCRERAGFLAGRHIMRHT